MKYLLTSLFILFSISNSLAEDDDDQSTIYIHGKNIHMTTDEGGCVSINEECIDIPKTTKEITDKTNNYTNTKFNELNSKIDSISKEAIQAAAIGIAASSLQFSNIPGKLSVGASFGTYKNSTASAFGLGYTSNTGKINSNIRGVYIDNNIGLGGGISFTLN